MRCNHSKRAPAPIGDATPLRPERRRFDRNAPPTTMGVIMADAAAEVRLKSMPPLESLTLRDFISSAGDQPPWLVEGLIADSAWSLVLGEPRSFKSMFAMNVAVAVAGGAQSILDFPIKANGPVLYVIEEGHRFFVAKRLEAMAARYGQSALDNLHILFRRQTKLDDPASVAQIRQKIEELQPILVVFDSFSRLMSGNENSKEDVQPALNPLDAIADDYGLAVLLIHHTNKGGTGSKTQRARGSSAIVASTQSTILFETYTTPGTGKVSIESKDDAGDKFDWSFDEDTYLMSRTVTVRYPSDDVLVAIVEELIMDGATARANAIRDKWNFTAEHKIQQTAFKAHLSRAVKAGRLVIQGGGHTTHYTLPLSGNDSYTFGLELEGEE